MLAKKAVFLFKSCSLSLLLKEPQNLIFSFAAMCSGLTWDVSSQARD